MLRSDQLTAVHARLRRYPAKQPLYWEGEVSQYFYQVQAGVVRLLNCGQQRDFVHRLIFPGEMFGENLLSSDSQATSSAETLTEAHIWLVERSHLLHLLRGDPALHWQFTQWLSELLHYQTQMRSVLGLLPAAEQIVKLMEYYVRKIQLRRTDIQGGLAELHCNVCSRMVEHEDGYTNVPFTRQQIADMLGLRVETVVRTVKELAGNGRLRLINHKIQYCLG